jgi:cytochrome c-type biogenesis protein CcmH/NrfG
MKRALDREPSRRHASTREFAYALHAALAMMPMNGSMATSTRRVVAAPSEAATKIVSPAPVSTSKSLGAPRQRRARLAIGAALALVALVILALVGRGPLRRFRASAALKEGIAAYRDGRHEIARTRLLFAADAAPNDPLPHVYLSRLARETSDLTMANREAIKAVRLGPMNGVALRELATTLYAMQDFSAARLFYVRAITVDPADHSAQGYLGCSLIQLGRTDEGLRWLQRAGSGTWSACAPRG